jgi:hypothetical protein
LFTLKDCPELQTLFEQGFFRVDIAQSEELLDEHHSRGALPKDVRVVHLLDLGRRDDEASLDGWSEARVKVS